jgi:hypothetical protein
MHLPSSTNPLQPLNHRWLCAGCLVEQGQHPSSRYDDSWVEQAVQYLTALATCRDDADRQHLAGQMPAIAQANALHHAHSPLLRWAVEARVLFFAVRDKLRADLQIRPIEPSLSLAEMLDGVELKPWRFAPDDGGDRHPEAPPAAAGDTAAGQRGGRRSGRRSGVKRKS